VVTEDLNRRWYQQQSGHRISDIPRHAVHKTIPWTAVTLDGLVREAVNVCSNRPERDKIYCPSGP
jgi:hypothetical protein